MRFLVLLIAFGLPAALWSQEGTPAIPKLTSSVEIALLENRPCDVLVVFSAKADLSAAARIRGKAEKGQYVYRRLLETAERSQQRARALLRQRDAYFQSFFIVNAIAIHQASAEVLAEIAALPEVERIASDPTVTLAPPEQSTVAPTSLRAGVEWGIAMIRAPEVWAMGYTGQGITVGGADTGYEWQHPAIRNQYRGYNPATGDTTHHYHWHDAIHEISPLSGDSIPDPSKNPCGVNVPYPCDDNSHGTHTMGTMVGDDGQGNQIGVAPGARWVACRNMERGNGKPSTYIECFEWFLAPTDLNGKNPRPDLAPHVINNSWYCSESEGCTDLAINDLLRQAIVALRAAGVFVVVSNGNSGSKGCASTFGPPAYFEESFSVGATADNDSITGFSSRGPVTIDGSRRLKPNVVAPGAAVRSCVRNGGYAHFWGTSMAGPHVAGLVALILSARPDLAGEVDLLEDIIEQTAVPKFGWQDCSDSTGLAYPNNTYGYGRVDALAAVLKALATTTTTAPSVQPFEIALLKNPVSDVARFRVRNAQGRLVLTLHSAEGRGVRTLIQNIDAGETLLGMPMEGLPAGLYFWKAQIGPAVVAGKCVRQP
ncbi:MAG: S8 family serine peptidase [Saprospiraceae bacterium]|nr:S8 family serine peptidase [Saprospiraceae bacterium]MDW8228821.1 S8 family serine peptidase [Saprospiraceae bacterium]